MTDHGTQTFKEIAEENTILRTLVGSSVHGLSIAGTDDIDLMGICVEPARYVIGLEKFEQYIFRTAEERTGIRDTRSGPGDIDLTVFSLRKWLRLALAGNPTVLTPLFAPAEHVQEISDLGEVLRESTAHILSREAGKRYLGYLQGQRKRMEDGTVGKRVNRPELVEKYSYDVKFAGHAVRLGVQGVELLETGRLSLPMTDPWRSVILDIRVGKYGMDDVISMVRDLEEQITILAGTSSLPPMPDYEWANQFLVDAYIRTWNGTDDR